MRARHFLALFAASLTAAAVGCGGETTGTGGGGGGGGEGGEGGGNTTASTTRSRPFGGMASRQLRRIFVDRSSSQS